MISRFLLSRRAALRAGAAMIVAPAWARADEGRLGRPGRKLEAGVERHGLSTFGDLREPPDFKAFGYVNTTAPKGGMVGQEMYGTFNSLNAYVMRGDPAAAMSLIFDSLMTGSLDERDALYGLVAKSVWVSPDRRTYRFRLRKEARFHDGSPLTAKDVVFSLNTLKTKGHPTIRVELRDVENVVAEADDVVTITLAATRSRETPLMIARQPIFSAAYYANHPFEESTLDPPLGSGAYKVGTVRAGPLHRVRARAGLLGQGTAGQCRPEQLRSRALRIFRERQVAFEAFKSGAINCARGVHLALIWATAYDFPAVRDGRVKGGDLPDENAIRHPGLVLQHAPTAVQGSARARSDRRSVSISTGRTATSCIGSYKRIASYLPQHRHEGEGASGRARKGAARTVPRQAAGGGFRRTLSFRRYRTARVGPQAAQAGQRSSTRGGLQAADGTSDAARRQAADDRVPRFHQHAGAAHAAVHPKSCASSESRRLRHRRSGAIQAAGWTNSIST